MLGEIQAIRFAISYSSLALSWYSPIEMMLTESKVMKDSWSGPKRVTVECVRMAVHPSCKACNLSMGPFGMSKHWRLGTSVYIWLFIFKSLGFTTESPVSNWMSRYGDLVLLNSAKFFLSGHSCNNCYYWPKYFGDSLIAECSLVADFIAFTATLSACGLRG